MSDERDEEMAELREQVAFQRHRAVTYMGDYDFLNRQHKSVMEERDGWRERAEGTDRRLTLARERLDALIADGFGATTDTLRNLRAALDGMGNARA